LAPTPPRQVCISFFFPPSPRFPMQLKLPLHLLVHHPARPATLLSMIFPTGMRGFLPLLLSQHKLNYLFTVRFQFFQNSVLFTYYVAVFYKGILMRYYTFKPVFRILRIHMFLGLPDPDSLVRGMDPDPDPDPSIIKNLLDFLSLKNYVNVPSKSNK
jgi:hypothetical protein